MKSMADIYGVNKNLVLSKLIISKKLSIHNINFSRFIMMQLLFINFVIIKKYFFPDSIFIQLFSRLNYLDCYCLKPIN